MKTILHLSLSPCIVGEFWLHHKIFVPLIEIPFTS